MKRILYIVLGGIGILAVLCFMVWLFRNSAGNTRSEKPVIYLYPEQEQEVSVRLDYDGKLTCTYPAYDDGWNVTAAPDGTITDESGQEYNYLYWEGDSNQEYDFSEGFCVAGENTAEFLEDALDRLGLTRREANEFIVYWLPRMEQNEYNLISFQSEAYTDSLSGNPGAVPFRPGTQRLHSRRVGRQRIL